MATSELSPDEKSVTSDIGWELNKKHIFILSSSGKPIYSRYGDEQELVTTFGLLQAVISIILDSGDSIKCIRAGKRKIVYFIKNSLYFVSMSSTNESELILMKQLSFIYNQILLVLTAKVHDVLTNNPSADIRQLLGSDTTRLISSACQSDLTPTCIAFESVKSFICAKDLRDDILFHLKYSVEKSGAVMGILLYKDQLISYCCNTTVQINLNTSDVLLLSHFVSNSTYFRSNDQHWVPICLPEFNSKGYLQAYISDIKVLSKASFLSADVTVILVASSADPDLFKELHRGKKYLEQCLVQPSIADRIHVAVSNQNKAVDKYLEPSMSIHFLYKFRPVAVTKGNNTNTNLPSQFIESTIYVSPSDKMESIESMWTHYQRLAVCIRRGSCTAESTLFNIAPTTATAAVHTPTAKKSEKSSVGSNAKDGQSGPVSVMNSNLEEYLTSLQAKAERDAEGGGGGGAGGGDPTDCVSILTSPPTSDHALAYTVLSTGQIIVALATFDSELFVTYPGTVTPLDASTMADFLSRSLKLDSNLLFQVQL